MNHLKETHFLSRKQKDRNKKKDSTKSGPLKITAADKLTSDYVKSITDGHGRKRPVPLTADSGQPLEGFFFGYLDGEGQDNGLKTLLQNPNFVGFYLGLGEDTQRNSHTLVLYGVTKKNGNDLTLHIADDEIYDFCDPCPPVCKS